MNKLTRDFYLRDTTTVAKDLLGKELVFWDGAHHMVAVISETEAYLGVEDKASHSYGGLRTSRTQVMFLPGGHAYVYLIYGIYSLVNIITEPAENPTGVMIRAARPVRELEVMAYNRFGKAYDQLTPAQVRGLMDGPGKFSMAMGIDTRHTGMDLLGETFYLRDTGYRPPAIGVGKRIGIDYAEEDAHLPLRFYIKEEGS